MYPNRLCCVTENLKCADSANSRMVFDVVHCENDRLMMYFKFEFFQFAYENWISNSKICCEQHSAKLRRLLCTKIYCSNELVPRQTDRTKNGQTRSKATNSFCLINEQTKPSFCVEPMLKSIFHLFCGCTEIASLTGIESQRRLCGIWKFVSCKKFHSLEVHHLMFFEPHLTTSFHTKFCKFALFDGCWCFCLSVYKWIDNHGAVGDDDGTLFHHGRNSTSHFFFCSCSIWFMCALCVLFYFRRKITLKAECFVLASSFFCCLILFFEIREERQFKWCPTFLYGAKKNVFGQVKASARILLWPRWFVYVFKWENFRR